MVDATIERRVIDMAGRGLRGESFADIARRTNSYGAIATDADAAVLSKFKDDLLAYAEGSTNFRATFVEAIADFAVGQYFSCAETGALRIYKRTGAMPFYADQGDSAAPLTKALMASTGGAALVGADDGASGTKWTTIAGFIALMLSTAGSANVGFSHAVSYPAGTIGSHIKQRVSIKDAPFNVVGGPVSTAPASLPDETAGITAAINYALANGCDLHIPAGAYKGALPTITKALKIYGDGAWSSLLYSTATGTTDALVISPPSGAGGVGNTGLVLQDFALLPVAAGNGGYGIRIQLTSGAFLSNSEISRVLIGQFGNQGLYFDNSVANGDGFFTWTVRRSWITNGIKGTKVGDSINIEQNTIPGGNFVGVNMTGLTGARQLVIGSNNITTLGGSVYLEDAYGSTVLNNQCEYLSSTTNYPGSLAGLVTIHNCLQTTIEGNTITPYVGGSITLVPAAVAITGTSKRTYLRGANEITQGQNHHISTTAGTDMVFIDQATRYNTVNPVFSFLGTDTRGIWINLTLINSWVQTSGWAVPRIRKDESGRCQLGGAVSSGSGVIANLPAAYCPDYNHKQPVSYDGSTTCAHVQVATSAGGGGIVAVSAPGNVGLHLDGITYQAAFTN